MTRQLARRQRRDRLAGIALAVLGVAVLIIAVIALRHPGNRSAVAGTATTTVSHPAPPPLSSPSPSPSTRATTSSPTPSRSSTSTSPASQRLPLVVLNNTSAHGLAEQARARFEAGGWTVSGTGNLVNNIVSTCAYYDPSVSGAKQAAMQLQAQFPSIKRVEPKFAELPPGPIVVVLTSDYS